MQWDVKLRNPFSYSNIGLVLLVIAIFGILLVILIDILSKKVKEIKETPKPIDVNMIKNEYLAKIDNLIKRVNNKEIKERKAYNELSVIIREFIFKTTHIDVLKYTLADAKATNNKELIKLLNEYYEPEFSSEGKGDLNTSIENTRKVIREWN